MLLDTIVLSEFCIMIQGTYAKINIASIYKGSKHNTKKYISI